MFSGSKCQRIKDVVVSALWPPSWAKKAIESAVMLKWKHPVWRVLLRIGQRLSLWPWNSMKVKIRFYLKFCCCEESI